MAVLVIRLGSLSPSSFPHAALSLALRMSPFSSSSTPHQTSHSSRSHLRRSLSASAALPPPLLLLLLLLLLPITSSSRRGCRSLHYRCRSTEVEEASVPLPHPAQVLFGAFLTLSHEPISRWIDTVMSDLDHLEKFNHDILLDLQVNESKLDYLCSNDLDTLLVLDLEGKVEIIEFPVLMMDAKSSNCIDFFHRFVRPVQMGEHQVNEYIQGKYGPFGVDRVWHDTAIPFKEVLQEFEAWLTNHHLLNKTNGALHRAAFVTCGNWDVKTKIPQQCKDSNVKLPAYFMEWINLKDVYVNFYNRQATGMRPMLQQLGIPLVGSHHLGIDDTKNIARVLQRMILDGCPLEITARRKSMAGGSVEFLFENRIDGRRYSRQYRRQ